MAGKKSEREEESESERVRVRERQSQRESERDRDRARDRESVTYLHSHGTVGPKTEGAATDGDVGYPTTHLGPHRDAGADTEVAVLDGDVFRGRGEGSPRGIFATLDAHVIVAGSYVAVLHENVSTRVDVQSI